MWIHVRNSETLLIVKHHSKFHLIIMAMLVLAGCNGGGGSQSSATTHAGIVHFVPNSHAFWSDPTNWTTSFGPAYADITLASSNFVPCRGGPFALCYYSGPSSGATDLSCTLSADGN